MPFTAPPPDPSKAVFTVHESSTISAPIDTVWNTLLDFKSYREWNSFVRNLTVLDSPSPRLSAVGQRIQVTAALPPTLETDKGTSAVAKCNIFEPERYRVGWVSDSWMPGWFFYISRLQTLTQLDDGNVKYESLETFNGILAYVARPFMEKNLVLGTKLMGQELKERVEGMSQ